MYKLYSGMPVDYVTSDLNRKNKCCFLRMNELLKKFRSADE